MTTPAPALADAEFDAIEAAVRETQRGRWFLGEFGRREQRSALEDSAAELRLLSGHIRARLKGGGDLQAVLEALDRLDRRIDVMAGVYSEPPAPARPASGPALFFVNPNPPAK